MVHLPRRYFFQARNEKRWSKEKRMGGEYRNLTQDEINGYTTRDPMQETIDSLNAAIDRLDKTINEMKEQLNGKNE